MKVVTLGFSHELGDTAEAVLMVNLTLKVNHLSRYLATGHILQVSWDALFKS